MNPFTRQYLLVEHLDPGFHPWLSVPAPWMVAVPIALTVLVLGTATRARLVPPRRPRPAMPSSAPAPGPLADSRIERRHRIMSRGTQASRRNKRIRRNKRNRRTNGSRRVRPPDDTMVADWCDALARAVRSGDTLAAALRSVPTPGPLGPAIGPVLLALDRGASVATAAQTARHRSSGLDAAVTVLVACASLGGPAAEPLDRVAATLRRRVADTAERRAQSAQARLSALTLTVLPGGFLAVLAITSASVRGAVTTAAGATSVGIGAVVNLLGWAWMRRIIGGAA